jgi:hypothetical protein
MKAKDKKELKALTADVHNASKKINAFLATHALDNVTEWKKVYVANSMIQNQLLKIAKLVK